MHAFYFALGLHVLVRPKGWYYFHCLITGLIKHILVFCNLWWFLNKHRLLLFEHCSHYYVLKAGLYLFSENNGMFTVIFQVILLSAEMRGLNITFSEMFIFDYHGSLQVDNYESNIQYFRTDSLQSLENFKMIM